MYFRMRSIHTTISEVFVMFLLLPGGAFAGHCTQVGSHWYCGGVVNKASMTMKYTTNPNDNSVSGWCKFWNWDGYDNGDAGPTLHCTQHDLAKGKSYGGGGSSKGPDVDAFCYAANDYVVDTGGGYLRRVTKGVWTRIHDDQIYTCKMSGGLPLCTIS